MKTIMIYALLALLGLNFQSCGWSNNKTRDMKRYIWQPHVASPVFYPADVKYGFVYYGDNDSRFPIMDRYPRKGIAKQGGSVALSGKDGGMSIPNGLNIVWLCRVGAKMYEFNNAFSEELISKMAALFEHGYSDDKQKHETYEDFIITLLPGGKILLHLGGIGRTVFFDTLQADEINMSMAVFEDNKTLVETPLEYAQRTLPLFHERALANFEKNGIPCRLWNTYLEKFPYDIKIEFENEKSVINPSYGYSFMNGDMFKSYDEVIVDSLARIKRIVFTWNVVDTTYTGHFHFNEEDVIDNFRDAFGNNPSPNVRGEFSIKVSKYNNWFDIFLRVGEKEFKFDNQKRTQIHVFRQGTDQHDRDAVVFYDNYRGEDPKRYIGE